MPYPDDDSCPICGNDNGSGRPCSPCPIPCLEHPDEFVNPDESCKFCEVEEVIEGWDDDQKKFLEIKLLSSMLKGLE